MRMDCPMFWEAIRVRQCQCPHNPPYLGYPLIKICPVLQKLALPGFLDCFPFYGHMDWLY